MTPPLTYQNIYISEGFVYPDSNANEWIELYNANPYTIYLNNWYIDDVTDSGATPKVFTTTLLPNTYIAIEMTSSLFNNTGDTIQLLDSAKTIKDSITYTGSQQNKSIGRASLSSSTVCIQNPSKGKLNEPCINPNEDTTISTTPTTTPSPSFTPTIAYTPHILGIQTKLLKPTHILRKESYTYEYSKKDKELHEKTKKSEQKTIPILATAYSLLSFLSITAKMIIIRH
nr:lamin tail domain-containing protein [uncultured Flavobacterium sp.]